MNVVVGIELNMLTRPTISQSTNRCVSASMCIKFCQFTVVNCNYCCLYMVVDFSFGWVMLYELKMVFA